MAPSPVINLDRELDRLFQAPFAEFVGARNGVAAMLKKAGRADESARVRGLAKPSYTAWLVNQLYWNARDELDAFLKASDRVRGAEQALLEGRKAAGHAELLSARAAALAAVDDAGVDARRGRRHAAEPGPGRAAEDDARSHRRVSAAATPVMRGAGSRRIWTRRDLRRLRRWPAWPSRRLAARTQGGRRRRRPSRPVWWSGDRWASITTRGKPPPRRARRCTKRRPSPHVRRTPPRPPAEAERKARLAVDAAKARLAEVERAVKSADAEVAATTAAFKARQAEARKAAAAAAAAQKALDHVRQPRRRGRTLRHTVARTFRYALVTLSDRVANGDPCGPEARVYPVAVTVNAVSGQASRCTHAAPLRDAPCASRARGCRGTGRRPSGRACSRACTAC